MEGDIADLPNDVDALKAALTVERARIREVVAERDAGAAEWRWHGPRHLKTWP
jgi:hypothetical protein